MQTHSGIQRQVLALYRECLQAASRLPTPQSQQAARAFTRAEFRQNVGRLEVLRIEHQLRAGRKKLERYTAPGVVGFSWEAS